MMIEPTGESDEAPDALRNGVPHDRPVARLADVLHSLAVHLHRVLRRADSEGGVSPAQLSALWALVHGGHRTARELAEAEQVSAPTMTRLVQGLEAMRLVARAPDPFDRRAVRIIATRRGRALLRAQRARATVELGDRVRALPLAELEALASATELIAELLRLQRGDPGSCAAFRAQARRPDGGAFTVRRSDGGHIAP